MLLLALLGAVADLKTARALELGHHRAAFGTDLGGVTQLALERYFPSACAHAQDPSF